MKRISLVVSVFLIVLLLSVTTSIANISKGYVIITHSSIVNNSLILSTFVEWKELNGYNVYVITELDWGGGEGVVAANHIRNWLKANYIKLDIKYVLLIGDQHPYTGSVPMKTFYSRNNDEKYSDNYTYIQSVSDLYYADLTSNWNFDGDLYFGEFDDDFEGMKFNWDIYVGRIPFYGNYEDLDSILLTTINYENTPYDLVKLRKNMLIAIPEKGQLNTSNHYLLGENIVNNLLSYQWNYFRIYDSNFNGVFPEKTDCTVENVLDVWQRDSFDIVVFHSHGSYNSANYIMNSDTFPKINNTDASIIFLNCCHTATPEKSDNLAYTLLKNNNVAVVGSSRVSWWLYGSNFNFFNIKRPEITSIFIDLVVNHNKTVSEALQEAKTMLPISSEELMNYFNFNLYGDPSVRLGKSSMYRQYKISGILTDENEVPISGVILVVKGKYVMRLIKTNNYGEFYTEVPNGNYILYSKNKNIELFNSAVDIYVDNEDIFLDLRNNKLRNIDNIDTVNNIEYNIYNDSSGGGCNISSLNLINIILLLFPLMIIMFKTK